MKVLKFGGSSLANSDAIRRVKEIVETSAHSHKVIVVVSALGGITDSLIRVARCAANRDDSYQGQISEIRLRHLTIANQVVTHNRNLIIETLTYQLENLSNILKGVYLIGDLSPKSQNVIVSYGERLSSIIVSGVIQGAEHFDAIQFIKTTPYHNKHAIELQLTNRLIKETIHYDESIAVIGGFISSDSTTGDITNLGRGGSDYTASLIASSLCASELEIWSDVDGFMTADPRVIPHAHTIPELSFVEAMELCNFGAKVIYPPTIYPAYNSNIPIHIRNTFNPNGPSTIISDTAKAKGKAVVRGISSIDNTTLLTITGLGMVGVIGVNYRIFKALAKSGISVFFVSQAASENNTSIGVSSTDGNQALKCLTEEFTEEIERGEINSIEKKEDVATVAIVGEGMREQSGIIGKLFGTVGRNGINIIASAQGAGETNISFIIKKCNLQKTLGVIHDSFFLSENTQLNIFLSGVGLVGGNLIKQITEQQEMLKRELALDIRVVGITNSKHYIYSEEGLNLNEYKNELNSSTLTTSPQIFSEMIIRKNLFNSVFIDCTASTEVAQIYETLLENNISIVAANKSAASSNYANYRKLKDIARSNGVKFLFETNVGAGLPIINTINDMIRSGDKILRIEAVVSGTLNYLFNVMSENIPLSKAVQMALDAGYAEPDPRLDLNGMDVIRKIVILSREAGYEVECSDVKSELFLPQSLFDGDLKEFWQQLPKEDAVFEQKRKELAAEGKRWRYIATMERGELSVALRSVDSLSPFYDLEGSNNVILLTTKRYNHYPLQIKGYGAGAEVTAAGVFADIINISNL